MTLDPSIIAIITTGTTIIGALTSAVLAAKLAGAKADAILIDQQNVRLGKENLRLLGKIEGSLEKRRELRAEIADLRAKIPARLANGKFAPKVA